MNRIKHLTQGVFFQKKVNKGDKTSICVQHACVLVMLNLNPFECLLELSTWCSFSISGKQMNKHRAGCFVILRFAHR